MPSSSDPQVTLRHVRLFLVAARAANQELPPLLERFGLPPDAVTAEAVTLPLSTFIALTEELSARMGDANLGVTVASNMPPGSFGLAEYVARSSLTLGEGLQRLSRFAQLINDKAQNAFERDDQQVSYRHRLPGHPECLGRHGNELGVLFMLRTIEQVLGARVTPRQAWFAHPAPADPGALAGALGVAPEFGCGENGLAFDASLMEQPLMSADPALRGTLELQANAKLATLPSSDPELLAEVNRQIRQRLEEGPSLERIATGMGIGGRTLQRRLSDLQTSFAGLLANVRYARARELLADPRLEVTEVAFLLGYSDATAFIRAFKTWSGVPPAEFRRGAQAG